MKIKDIEKKLNEISAAIGKVNHKMKFLEEEINRVRIEREQLLDERKKCVDSEVAFEIKKISEFVENSLRAISEQTTDQLYRLHRESRIAAGKAKNDAKEKLSSIEKKAEKKLATKVKKTIKKETDRIKDELVQMEMNAITDDLTRAFNRRYFEPRMRVEMGIARRSGRPMSIILFDIDGFKEINDIYGHQAGDMVLSSLASRLSDDLRKEDVLIRYGGEEFVIILPGVKKEQALKTADRLRSRVSQEKLKWEGSSFNITVSGGVASYPDEAKEFSLLFKKADEKLLRSKKSGKNKITG